MKRPFIFLGIPLVLSVGVLLWFWLRVVASNTLQQPVKVTIASGQGINEISKALYDQGAISNTLIFETYVWLLQKEARVQAGVYEVPPAENIVMLTKRLTMGEVSEKENNLTLIEGWTVEQIAGEVERRTNIQSDAFLEATKQVGNDAYLFLNDRPEGASLEGFLFPDTYRVYKQTTPQEILEKCLTNFDQKLTSEMREKIQERGRTIYEIVTMASILEREVKTLEDKKMAADVFWKRLSIGMALQSDATVNYVTGKKTSRASAEDLKIDSPYNTYRTPGLPPGPISNPGSDAMRAALEPTPNDYYYFLTKENGEAVFATDLNEHHQNKEKYLK